MAGAVADARGRPVRFTTARRHLMLDHPRRVRDAARMVGVAALLSIVVAGGGVLVRVALDLDAPAGGAAALWFPTPRFRVSPVPSNGPPIVAPGVRLPAPLSTAAAASATQASSPPRGPGFGRPSDGLGSSRGPGDTGKVAASRGRQDEHGDDRGGQGSNSGESSTGGSGGASGSGNSGSSDNSGSGNNSGRGASGGGGSGSASHDSGSGGSGRSGRGD